MRPWEDVTVDFAKKVGERRYVRTDTRASRAILSGSGERRQ